MFTSDGKYNEAKAFGDFSSNMKLDYANYQAIKPHVMLFYESAGYSWMINSIYPSHNGLPKSVYGDKPGDTEEIKAARIAKFQSFDRLLRGRIFKTVDNNTVQDLANLSVQCGVVFWAWIKSKCVRDTVGFSNAVRERLTTRKMADVENNMERLLREMDQDLNLLSGKETFSVSQRLELVRESQATISGKLTKDDPYYAPLVSLNSKLTHDDTSVDWDYAKTELLGHYSTYFQNEVEKIVLSKSTPSVASTKDAHKDIELNFTVDPSNPTKSVKLMLKALNKNPSISAANKNKIKALAVDVAKQPKDLSNVDCYNCGKKGHYASNCYLPGGGAAHGKGGK